MPAFPHFRSELVCSTKTISSSAAQAPLSRLRFGGFQPLLESGSNYDHLKTRLVRLGYRSELCCLRRFGSLAFASALSEWLGNVWFGLVRPPIIWKRYTQRLLCSVPAFEFLRDGDESVLRHDGTRSLTELQLALHTRQDLHTDPHNRTLASMFCIQRLEIFISVASLPPHITCSALWVH